MSTIDPGSAATRLANLGFLANSDLAHGAEGAFLMVALRAAPSRHHFDPEYLEYWVNVEGLGRPARFARDGRLPYRTAFSWGPVHVVDRLGITNEYLTFGGGLLADLIGEVVVAVFTSPAPLFKRGGHSQEWDVGAASVGAFFGRLLLAVDVIPGFEPRLTEASALARYAAFLADETRRYQASAALRDASRDVWGWLETERRWLQATSPDDWQSGERLATEIRASAAPGAVGTAGAAQPA